MIYVLVIQLCAVRIFVFVQMLICVCKAVIFTHYVADNILVFSVKKQNVYSLAGPVYCNY